MVFYGNIVGKTCRYFSVTSLGKIVACVYEHQEVETYLLTPAGSRQGRSSLLAEDHTSLANFDTARTYLQTSEPSPYLSLNHDEEKSLNLATGN